MNTLNYEVVFEPIKDINKEKLPFGLQKKIDNLFYKLQENPKKTIPELLKLIQEYPEVPILTNYLYSAYTLSNQEDKVQELAVENYKKFPDYIFSKLNYALLCLEKDNLSEIPVIFDNKFDLDLIYPERKKFHISEYKGFANIICRYLYKSGDIEKAKEVFENFRDIDSKSKFFINLRKEFFPDFIDTLNLGDSVIVKDGIQDYDFGHDISNWQGRVIDIIEDDNMVDVEWDSITLKNLSPDLIGKFKKEELEWDTIYMNPEDILLSEPRDTEEDVELEQERIRDEYYADEKIPGFPYQLEKKIRDFPDIAIQTVLAFYNIYNILNGRKKTFDKITIKEILDISPLENISELIKSIEELEKYQLIFNYQSSVLKMDRERWFFLFTDENNERVRLLKNKELNLKDLEKLK